MKTSKMQASFLTGRWAALTLAMLALGSAPFGRAQQGDKPTPSRAMAREANPDWEVATVKASDPNDTNGQHINFRGSRVLLQDTTVEQFLLLGYGVQQSQLAGIPDWTRTVPWDVGGVPDVEGQPSWKQLQGLIQKILGERFGLHMHREQREMPVFALTVAKGGPKITPDTSDPNGWLDQQNGERNGRHVENLRNASMADLALILQFHVDRPVVDLTGLKGRYDLKLQWAVDDATTAQPDAPPGLFAALPDQTGLRLDRVKAPAEVLVIDKVERPGAN